MLKTGFSLRSYSSGISRREYGSEILGAIRSMIDVAVSERHPSGERREPVVGIPCVLDLGRKRSKTVQFLATVMT